MTTITAPLAVTHTPNLVRTARVTGVWYLALAITGLLGFVVVRAQIYDMESADSTYANLVEKAGLAQLGFALELAVLVAQALAAVWFYKLYREVSHVAAIAIMVFGMANAAAIMASAIFMGTALAITTDASLAGLDGPSTVQLLYTLSASAWSVGGIFFGLWLIPMGWAVLRSGFAPRALGWILIAGSVGYIASSVVDVAVPDAPVALINSLPLLATVGELWMVGYLLARGVRRSAVAEVSR